MSETLCSRKLFDPNCAHGYRHPCKAQQCPRMPMLNTMSADEGAVKLAVDHDKAAIWAEACARNSDPTYTATRNLARAYLAERKREKRTEGTVEVCVNWVRRHATWACAPDLCGLDACPQKSSAQGRTKEGG